MNEKFFCDIRKCKALADAVNVMAGHLDADEGGSDEQDSTVELVYMLCDSVAVLYKEYVNEKN